MDNPFASGDAIIDTQRWNGPCDVIGDVHGMRRTLEALIEQLGYEWQDGVPTHPSGRHLVSVGDLLDRGPDPLGCLELFQKAVATGQARMILGNHEINALHFMAGLRPDNERTRRQFQTTLVQIEADRDRWNRAADFLATVPTRLELDEGRLRVIHACWDANAVARLPERLDTPELLRRAAYQGDLFDDMETLLKGPEEDWQPYTDKDGHRRTRRRIPWWETYPEDQPLVVFGHYWFPWLGFGHDVQEPSLIGPGRNATCLDFSAGLGGPLVAMRYPEREFVVQRPCD